MSAKASNDGASATDQSLPDPDGDGVAGHLPARRDEHEGEGATRGTARMEAFADGVFAIAFTLPIYNVLLPPLRDGGAHLAQDLLHNWPQDVGYLFSSTIIGLYWVHHHFSGAIYRTTGHWFLLGTALFLITVGFVAFPARAFAESLPYPAALPAAATFLVCWLAVVSLTWLLKWSIGLHRGMVDPRLEPAYLARLNRQYWMLAALKVSAVGLVLIDWRIGIAVTLAGVLHLIKPPETPRYITEAPVVEGQE